MAAPVKLRVLIMVLVWLLSGSGTRRCTDARRLPFENRRIRRRLNMNHFRPTVMDMVEQHGLQVDRWDEPYIHGVAELVVGFQYDHTRVLTDMDREQYWYWKSQGVPERDLWFFGVLQQHALPQPVPSKEHISKRFCRTFTTMSDENSEELCDLMDACLH